LKEASLREASFSKRTEEELNKLLGGVEGELSDKGKHSLLVNGTVPDWEQVQNGGVELPSGGCLSFEEFDMLHAQLNSSQILPLYRGEEISFEIGGRGSLQDIHDMLRRNLLLWGNTPFLSRYLFPTLLERWDVCGAHR